MGWDGPIDEGVQRVVGRLQGAGFRALLAGGCVRDVLMGQHPKDWDVATDADPQAVIELFEHTVPIGVDFGIVMVVLPEGNYEVARFRRDGAYDDGRHPSEITFSSAEEDAKRRDFTINGMFIDLAEGGLLDYVGGQEDIQGQTIRAIGDPQRRFSEDYLRMLRAVRFATRLSFSIEPDTFDAIGQNAARIQKISPERVRDELTGILTSGRAGHGLELLLRSGLLEHLLPEVAALKGVAQPPEYHPEGDVWTHVKLVLDALEEPSPELAWAALLHDIGKPPTFEMADRIRFNGHDAVGAQMAAGICQRLRMSNAAAETIVGLVAQHMRFGNVRRMRQSKLKRFLRQENFLQLLALHKADCLGSHGLTDLYEFCLERLAEAQVEDLEPERLLTGRDLIAMGFESGPAFKQILAAVEDGQLEGRLATKQEAETFVKGRFAKP